MLRTLLIDSHVHIYPTFDLSTFLSTAHVGFSKAAKHITGPDPTYVIVLTETAKDDAFSRLVAGSLSAPGWQVDIFADDPTAIRVHDGGARSLIIIAGRQIVTAERIEVLALCTLQSFEDGDTADNVMRRLVTAETPQIVPWGVGKWLGRRGALLRTLLDSHSASKGVMMGDNAGRPLGWPQSSVFRIAMTKDVPILPGSDPLPIDGAEANVGRYGCIIEADIDLSSPGASLKKVLLDLRGQPRAFGKRKGLISVAMDQMALRRSKKATR